MLGRFFGDYWLILLTCALGAAATYLLLPRPRRSWTVFLGSALGASALAVAGFVLVKPETIWVETLLFYSFSALAIIGGVMVISHANPVHAALSFALVVLSTSGLFLLQAAPFLMAATIIVYAGAIIVTFLFVIMLAQQKGLSNADMRSREPFLATLAGFIVVAAVLCILQRTYDTTEVDAALQPTLQQTRQALAAQSMAVAKTAVGDRKEFFEQIRRLAPGANVDNAEEAFVKENLEALKTHLEPVHGKLARQRQSHGSLQPTITAGPVGPFSKAYVQEGGERLQASNVNALGRTLFTQYLIAVELAGVLLMVASIGAIVIVARRAEGLR